MGTGVVENAGTKLAKLGHDVCMGSRTAGGEKAKAFVKDAGASLPRARLPTGSTR